MDGGSIGVELEMHLRDSVVSRLTYDGRMVGYGKLSTILSVEEVVVALVPCLINLLT